MTKVDLLFGQTPVLAYKAAAHFFVEPIASLFHKRQLKD